MKGCIIVDINGVVQERVYYTAADLELAAQLPGQFFYVMAQIGNHVDVVTWTVTDGSLDRLCQKQPTSAYTPHSGNVHNISNHDCHLPSRDLSRFVYGGAVCRCGSVDSRSSDRILGPLCGSARIRESVGAAFHWLCYVAAHPIISSS